MSATRILGVLGGTVVDHETVELEEEMSTVCFTFGNLDLRQMTKGEGHLWEGRPRESDFYALLTFE